MLAAPNKSIDAWDAMIRLFKINRTLRLRATRAYLLTILVCTLLLFCFSIISLKEQRERVQELSSNNLRLLGERMVSEIEHRIELEAAACLNRKNLERLVYAHGQEQSLEGLRTYREQFESLKKVYPVAQHFFIFDRNQLVFPRISSPSTQSLSSLLESGNSPIPRKYSELFAQGEHAEAQLGQPALAAQVYLSAEKLDVSARLKALALFRRAGALQKARQQAAARKAYQTLIQSYGDIYDESQAPYALTLATAPEELSRTVFPYSQEATLKIYQSLIRGKWELSAEQAAYYLARLEHRLKLSDTARQASNFLDHFELAKAVQQELPVNQPQLLFKVIPQGFRHGNKSYQTYRASIPGPNGGNLIMGFSVSMPWIINSLISTYAKESHNVKIGAVSIVENMDAAKEEALNKDVYISFREIFPFGKLHISAYAMRLNELAASNELRYVGLSAFMFLCALSLGLFLYTRVSWDLRWFELRSDFVSGVSHDFKTPLSLIRLYSETLANDDQDYSSEDRRNYVRIIARESERMSRLIDNVLDFSKMEQGRRHYDFQEGDLTTTVLQAISDYSEYLTWRGFSVKSSIWPQLPPVRFNAEQVSQMILNLMDNARKYSGASRLIRVNVWVEGSEVVIEVQDSGVGIPAEEKEKIFQPFYRASKGKATGGCGLGLYLVDQVMKEHGGRVEVQSEVNKGSRFRLIFPVSGSRRASSRYQIGQLFAKIRSERQIQNQL
jgi:signal transduction histidine kinase